MAEGSTLILSNGGVRSLLATAMAVQEYGSQHAVLVHLKDGRRSSVRRQAFVKEQADEYKIREIIRIDLPHLQRPASAPKERDRPSALLHPQMILAALAQGVELDASRIVWPAQFNGSADHIAKVMEQVVLIRHIAEVEHSTLPAIETPLLDFTDQQLVEIGLQLDVPWTKSWSCDLNGEKPCLVCAACRRRHSGFEAAGVVDPLESVHR